MDRRSFAFTLFRLLLDKIIYIVGNLLFSSREEQ